MHLTPSLHTPDAAAPSAKRFSPPPRCLEWIFGADPRRAFAVE
jgi:hypothetical protein